MLVRVTKSIPTILGHINTRRGPIVKDFSAQEAKRIVELGAGEYVQPDEEREGTFPRKKQDRAIHGAMTR